MSITILHERNYAAQVVRLSTPFPIPNSDHLEGVNVLGYTVLTRKGNVHEGDLVVFFPAESQLSEHLARNANLYTTEELNADPTQKGYLGNNRRVRAIKLRGTISSALILPVKVVADIYDAPTDWLIEGLQFDTIDGREVCRKYVIQRGEPRTTVEKKKTAKAFKRVDEKVFPVHIETDQYVRNEHQLADDDILIVTQKLHGTSARFGRVPVRRKLTFLERLAKRVGVTVKESEFDTLAGSKKVIKDVNNPHQQHFYGSDVWSDYLGHIEAALPENVIVYGELVGYTVDGAEIQKGHTYGVKPGEIEFYVYRVAIVTEQGNMFDLSWDQVRTFCTDHGLQHVKELWRGFKKDFRLDDFIEKDFHAEFPRAIYPDVPVPLTGKGTGADEGVAIRVERGGNVPLLFKHKNPSHYGYETALLDEGIIDLESQEAA